MKKSYTLHKLEFIPNATKMVDTLTGQVMGVIEEVDGRHKARGVTHDDVDMIFGRSTEEAAADKFYEFWAVRNEGR